jgi:hypothetical protein
MQIAMAVLRLGWIATVSSSSLGRKYTIYYDSVNNHYPAIIDILTTHGRVVPTYILETS